jgi:hypothetical protein
VRVETVFTLTDDQLAELVDLVAARLNDRRNDWLSIAQASEQWDCSKDAVRMRAQRETVEKRYEGRRLYVRRKEG